MIKHISKPDDDTRTLCDLPVRDREVVSYLGFKRGNKLGIFYGQYFCPTCMTKIEEE